MMEVYTTTLLTLCVIALLLAVTVLLQNMPRATPRYQEAKAPTETPVRASTAHRTNWTKTQYSGEPSHHTKPRRPETASQPRLALPHKAMTYQDQIALITSALQSIARLGSNASSLIARRSLAKLQDGHEPVLARIHSARHKLQLIELGDDMTAARIAGQTLRQLPRLDHTA